MADDRASPTAALWELVAPPRQGWEGLVFQPELESVLRAIPTRWRNREHVQLVWGFRERTRSDGLLCLFAGDSGTGKTAVASVIAAELRLPLYRVNVAGVVSKYVGETEKNLARILDEAERLR